MSLLSKLVDERFMTHRQRSTSLAGMVSAALALGLFAYRFFVQHLWSWDLLAIVFSFVAIKLALMLWYVFTD
ncbi:MAG: hypothetical protein IT348_19655 [Candidatus Eisenbacteria bacterium]|nr:hypothetical protein [Candidatus Eisenbacteria bacterium]